MFSQGAFVNILTSDSKQWKMDLNNLAKFPALDHFELWLEHIPVGNEITELRSAFRSVPLIVHGPFIHTSLVSHIPEIVAVTDRRFIATMEFASRVDAKVVTFHAGTYPMFDAKEHVLEMLAGRFDRFSAINGPIATLENMPVTSHGTAKQAIGHLSDCEQLLKLLPNLRFTLDIGHCLQNEDDFIPFLEKHSLQIEDIHLHDGIPHGRGHLRLGTGKLDLSRFLEVLMRIKFSKYLSMETISLSDTKSSWETLNRTESVRGIRNIECISQENIVNRARDH
jgi:sugar phosphate isomerase/epimerase